MDVIDKLRLPGKRCLVTGGAGHIGRAIIKAFDQLGANALSLDVTPEADIQCDLMDEKQTRAAVDTSIERLGGLDVLVHAAAFVGTSSLAGWAVPFEEQTVSAWDSALRVNLTSAFVMAQSAQRALSESGQGSIVLVSSIYGMVGPDMSLYEGTEMANPAGYNASKGGLLQLTRYLATVLAPAIRVNAVSPGGVLRGQPEVFRERYEARTPLQRMANEDDVAGAVAYFASELSAYVTGQNLAVDGGWTVW